MMRKQASLFSRLFGRKKKTPAQAAQPVTADQAAPPAQTDPQVSFEHMSRLKKGLKHGSSSVAKVNVTGGAPGEQAVVPAIGQVGGESFDLRTFPRAFRPLESDEKSVLFCHDLSRRSGFL